MIRTHTTVFSVHGKKFKNMAKQNFAKLVYGSYESHYQVSYSSGTSTSTSRGTA